MKQLVLTKAERLLLARRREGITQQRAARRLRITRSRYVKIENGQVEFSLPAPPTLKPTDSERCFILRRREKITQEELAQEMGLCRYTINQMEMGGLEPSVLVEHWDRR